MKMYWKKTFWILVCWITTLRLASAQKKPNITALMTSPYSAIVTLIWIPSRQSVNCSHIVALSDGQTFQRTPVKFEEQQFQIVSLTPFTNYTLNITPERASNCTQNISSTAVSFTTGGTTDFMTLEYITLPQIGNAQSATTPYIRLEITNESTLHTSCILLMIIKDTSAQPKIEAASKNILYSIQEFASLFAPHNEIKEYTAISIPSNRFSAVNDGELLLKIGTNSKSYCNLNQNHVEMNGACTWPRICGVNYKIQDSARYRAYLAIVQRTTGGNVSVRRTEIIDLVVNSELKANVEVTPIILGAVIFILLVALAGTVVYGIYRSTTSSATPSQNLDTDLQANDHCYANYSVTTEGSSMGLPNGSAAGNTSHEEENTHIPSEVYEFDAEESDIYADMSGTGYSGYH